MRLFNTLTRRKEEVVPLEPGVVRMYTCGPTVYRYVHIGNLRSFLTADLLRRALTAQGYEVRHVKNITDVGHMRQEMVEVGEDKVIAAALAEGKTPFEIARFYTEAFLRDEAKFNILPAHVFPRATEHIPEMVRIVERLLGKGYAYRAGENIYFDISKFPAYGRLSGNQLASLLEGVRVEVDPLKRSPMDFTLWKGAEEGRQMKWPSPWGDGFPGWHIECSAMSTKYLGLQLDIHTGGVDNIFPHHEGEIAQSEGAFGLSYVRYWVHTQHVLAAGQKMAKSAGNAYTLGDVEDRGFEPLAFRYLCLGAHYRSRMNFTFAALLAAQIALEKLRRLAWDWARSPASNGALSGDVESWRQRFWDEVNDDIGLPRAMAAVWEMVHSDLPPHRKLDLLLDFDRVLGLDVQKSIELAARIPSETTHLLEERSELRIAGDYREADATRERIHALGYTPEDSSRTTFLFPARRSEASQLRRLACGICSSRQVPSRLNAPSTRDLSVVVLANGWPEDTRRVVAGALSYLGKRKAEVICVDNGTADGTAELLDEIAAEDPRVKVIHATHPLGEATGKNVALQQARGRYIVVLDTSTGLDGDVFSPLLQRLREERRLGIVGSWGLRTEDMKSFHEVAEGEVDAMQGYCFAFRRADLRRVGLMDERFSFYRNLDIDFSFQFRSHGFHIVAVPDLPLSRYEHRAYTALAPGELAKKSRRNFDRFFKKYHHRNDLLVTPGARGYVHEHHEGDGHDH
ncbi:MAG: cysteine--tRNA ligase [Chloroflexi bacterium]|nr:cysteine--tRNA ligase [Chloroflexota bacterium]